MVVSTMPSPEIDCELVRVLPASHDEEAESLGRLHVQAALDSELFPDRVVTGDDLHGTPAAGVTDTSSNVRHEAVQRVDIALTNVGYR